MKNLTIGKLAKLATVNVETIRYYQRINLIETPVKPIDGFRVYSQAILSQLLFIKRAKLLGFSLNEIKQLLQLNEGSCQQTQQIAEQKNKLILAKIDDLQKLSSTLQKHIQTCQTTPEESPCPLIECLSKNDT